MKKILVSCASVLLLALSVAAAPGSKIVEQFKKTFPNAVNVKWNEAEGGYFVSFYENGDFEKILYNKKGAFVRSWKYSDGKDLPTNIVMALNKKVNAGTIKGVTEITSGNNTSYEIKVGKNDKLYCLNIAANGTVIKAEEFIDANVNEAANTAGN
jgi:hypothetical protein